jgi:large repetitive protein
MPTISCPGNSTATATTGQCAAVVNYTVSGSDNCSGWSLSRTSGLQSGAQFPVGTNTVIWKNTDTGGNSTTCSFTVTVTDGQLPGISCPANITANAATGSCSATVNYTTPIVSDNCAGVTASHVSGGLSGSSFAKGVNTVQWKATDGSNNIKTCSFSITVNDTQAPMITCPANITANTAANSCAATVTFNNATATDNCTPPPVVTQTGGAASGSSFGRGVHTISFKATDGVGLTKTCTLRITVVDNILPTITCPAPIVKSTDPNLCTSVSSYSVTGMDNCGSVSVTRQSGLPSGANFPKGINTVVWRATDIAGNVKLCTFTVTVNDTQLPSLTCPQNISTNTTTGQCNRVVNYVNPTYSDNCAGGSISLYSGLASGSVFPTGVSTVVWRAFDNTANSTMCSFTITVTDNELPAITCPPSTTVSGSGSPCGFPANQINVATASDNCAVTSLTSNASTSLPAGQTVVIWTASDASNNTKTCAYTVTVTCGSSYELGEEKSYELGVMSYDAEQEEKSYELGVMSYAERESTHNSSLITHNFSMFPNPASDIVVITLSNQQINSKSNQQLIIHDALGREVWRRALNLDVEQVTIDLTDQRFEGGVYQVSLRTDKTTITKSLVVTRK